MNLAPRQIERFLAALTALTRQRAIATAPAGFAHIGGTVLGTLLDDIAAGKSHTAIVAAWAAKLDPAQYQNQTAAPTAGAIAQAEAIAAKLNIEPALHRRYAYLEEVPAIWWSRQSEAPRHAESPIFGHLLTPAPATPTGNGQPIVMTWEKFYRVVLPTATTLDVCIPPTAERFAAIVTAADPTAPPILQWDDPTTRNPFSWYYAHGIDAEIRRRVAAAGGLVEGVEVRASLKWENFNDLDLRVITPHGATVSYQTPRDYIYGGELDVDMNVSGETDTPVENIRWETAPEGRYQVLVNLYNTHRGCGVATPFTVEIEVAGQVATFSGETHVSNLWNDHAKMVRVADFIYHRGQPVLFTTAEGRPVASATSPATWNVTPGTYVPVTGIVPSPNLWGKTPMRQHGEHVFLLLKDCRDIQRGRGRGFYVETLRNELHPVRAVITAYNAQAEIAGAETASACGIGLSKSGTGNITLRVNGSSRYTIDRWD